LRRIYEEDIEGREDGGGKEDGHEWEVEKLEKNKKTRRKEKKGECGGTETKG
jgi:hypothetical protein